MSVSTSVYRCYDLRGELLYVGCSKTSEQRVSLGHRDKRWFGEVAFTRHRVYPCREMALAIEARAVLMLKPAYNSLYVAQVAKYRKAITNWKQKGFPGFDQEAANVLRHKDL